MKTLISTLAVLTLSFTTLSAKEGTFVSVVLHDTDQPIRISLSARQWIKITNFTQNNGDFAGAVVVYQGAAGLPGVAVLYASDATVTQVPHEDVFVGGPAIVTVAPVSGSTMFFTYQRGSD